MNRAKVIVRYGIAVDNIDVAAARARESKSAMCPFIALTKFPTTLWQCCSRYTENFSPPTGCSAKTNTNWNAQADTALVRFTAGLVGFGHIARRMAEKLKPLFAQVIAFDPFVNANAMAEHGVRR